LISGRVLLYTPIFIRHTGVMMDLYSDSNLGIDIAPPTRRPRAHRRADRVSSFPGM